MSSDSQVRVEEATALTEELQRAWAALMPQLSSSAPTPTPEQLEAIVTSPATILFVARDADLIVGSLSLAIFRVPTGVRAWIEDVVVDAGARGKGVGESLISAALERAAALGCRSVDLTSSPREAANRLYQRLGFQRRESNVYRYVASDT